MVAAGLYSPVLSSYHAPTTEASSQGSAIHWNKELIVISPDPPPVIGRSSRSVSEYCYVQSHDGNQVSVSPHPLSQP